MNLTADYDKTKGISRREFLALACASGAAMASGCATNPVSGERQFMIVTQAMEINFDRKWAPQQFSADYGAVQDARVNSYISQIGTDIAMNTHRPSMPYNFRAVNAVVVNAYTLPAGSIGIARGLMLEMDNEAQMASIIGHELAHVNWKHAAERISKSLFINALIAGGAAYLQHNEKKYADIAAGLGLIGANILLSKYSRDNEREADSTGMEYSVRAGHNPKGMPEVMGKFMSLHKSQPSAVELLFATHPMSDERYKTTSALCTEKYSSISDLSMKRERYMDNTASIRAIQKAILAMQNGEKAMYGQKYTEAEAQYQKGLAGAPDDYACLLMLSKCYMAQNKNKLAMQYSHRAQEAYPEEAQALHVSGMLGMRLGLFDSALANFEEYENRLPGNPNTIFYRGLCHEKMGHKELAAGEYQRYSLVAPNGDYAGYTYNSLVKWGYIKPTNQGG